MDELMSGCPKEKAESRLTLLENQELDSPKGVLSAELYCELLALYLLTDDLANAKFLWKRIPADVKSGCDELKAVWEVGKMAWKHDYGAIHSAINSFEWSDECKTIMTQYKENLRDHCLSLIAQGYSSVKMEYLTQILGLDQNSTMELVKKKNWTHIEDKNIVKPIREKQAIEYRENNEEHLGRLTQYILFLET